jgi:hypothetical protein
MVMFNFSTEQEPKGSPLFAAALAGGALGAMPASTFLDESLLRPGLDRATKAMSAVGDNSIEDVAKSLKEKLLDKKLGDKLHVTVDKNRTDAFYKTRKNYLPARAEVEKLLEAGGLKTIEGKVNPLKAIKDIRGIGGFVNLNPDRINSATLAHELGHATSLNKGQVVRNSSLFRFADSLGRKLQGSGTKGALAAAILAGSFDSDDNTKWLVPGGIALTQAPVLAEEGIASLRGMDALKSLYETKTTGVGVPVENMISKAVQDNAGKYLRRAWGTYGLGAAGLLAAPLLAMKARSEFDKWSKD